MPAPTEPSATPLPIDLPSRRDALRAGLLATAAGAAAAPLLAAGAAAGPRAATPSARMPVAYVPHGGGPWPFVEMGLDRAEMASLTTYLRSLRALPKTAPKAVLVVSAHWEEAVATVQSGARPPMLYDYYGFPPASYEIQWPAPGAPAVAARVQALLAAAGIASAAHATRGFDHGTFVPLKLTWPDADIPTLQLSLVRGLDPAAHLALGRALRPLRDEGVLLVGSGGDGGG